jgi:hypothetical protein
MALLGLGLRSWVRITLRRANSALTLAELRYNMIHLKHRPLSYPQLFLFFALQIDKVHSKMAFLSHENAKAK